jgi:hypothetical protein
MARAHGGKVIAGATSPSTLTHLQPLRLRGFNLPRAVGEFNAASSERARLSRLTYDLATHAAQRACGLAGPTLTALGAALTLDEPLDESALLERAHFGLHSELRVALDEGRRLRVQDIDALALTSVYSAAAGLLAERAQELARALDIPESETALGAGQWYDLLRALPEEADAQSARAFFQARLRVHAQSARVFAAATA